MQALLPLFVRWMLLVMLTTVLAPSFAWELAGGAAAHAGTSDQHSHDGHDRHPLLESYEHAVTSDGLCAACADHDKLPPCDDLQHHCCPGHVLSHLSASLHAAPSFLLPFSRFITVDRSNRQFSSRVPEGLERPPRSVIA